MKKEKDHHEINEDIRDKEIRLIGVDGEQLGVVSSKQAYMMALDKKLDLVKIAPNANPPVCKIMDFGKYRYEQQKREKEAKRKQKITSVKEIRLSLTIEDHDLNTKAKNAVKFLSDGDKVKVTVKFKGREMGQPQLGRVVLDKFTQIVNEYGTMEKEAKFEGKSLIVIFAPKDKN